MFIRVVYNIVFNNLITRDPACLMSIYHLVSILPAIIIRFMLLQFIQLIQSDHQLAHIKMQR